MNLDFWVNVKLLNLNISKKLFFFLVLNKGETKISEQFCNFLILISFILCADPIILKLVGQQKVEAKLIFLLKDGI